MDNEISQVVLAEKYLKDGETSALQLFERVAAGIASAEKDSKSRKHWAKQCCKNDSGICPTES